MLGWVWGVFLPQGSGKRGCKDGEIGGLQGHSGARARCPPDSRPVASVTGSQNPHFWQRRPEVGHPRVGVSVRHTVELRAARGARIDCGVCGSEKEKPHTSGIRP